MFTCGFKKVAFIGKLVNAVKTIKPTQAGTQVRNVKLPAAKPLATRVDGSKVTTDWGLKQGLKSGSVRYADIN